MKVKLLRRVFCVVMCVVILACSCVSVSAAQWAHITNGKLQITVTHYLIENVMSATTSLVSNFSYAVDYWDALSQVEVTEVDYYTQAVPTSGVIIHTSPGLGFWENATFGNTAVLALCHMYTETGVNIYPFFENSAGTLIDHAIVYYHPTTARYENYTHLNFRCLHAHETGHALGLEHIGSDAVMVCGDNSYYALQPADILTFKQLYGFN